MDATPHIFSLSQEERRKVYDEALERVRVASMEAAAEYKKAAAYRDPRADYYLGWRDQRMGCVLVVKHHTGDKSITVSRDGGDGPLVRLANCAIEVLKPESGVEFVLILIRGWYAPWLAKKDREAARRVRELLGITLPLTESREWTETEIETWTRLDKLRRHFNRRIQLASTQRPKRQAIGTRGHFA